MKKPTRAELEAEVIRLRAENEGYKAALKFMEGMTQLTRPAPIYVPYYEPVYPAYEITCSDTATGLTITAPPLSNVTMVRQ